MGAGRLEQVQAAGSLGRFAPSPTGALHFGSLLAALASYCDARHGGGRWQLRIDDIDGLRSVAGAAAGIQRTLENFGFQWDGPVRWQSARLELYRAALARLVDQQLIFACSCSRRSLPRNQTYPGRCRQNRLTAERLQAAFPLPDCALRMRMTGQVCFDDAIQGRMRFDLEQDVGDSVVWRRDGLVAYALACAVDDTDQVTHVVRGADLLEGTGTQLAIIKALQLTPPAYAHIPVATDANGAKLSKQTLAQPVDEGDPLTLLLQAWHFLGQLEMDAVSLEEFWTQAIACWQMSRVPQRRDRQFRGSHDRDGQSVDGRHQGRHQE